MKIHLRAYGIAADILQSRKVEIRVKENATVSDLKNQLVDAHEDFGKLSTLSFAIGEEYVADDTVLREQDVVVIIPPVSGG